MRRTRAFFVGAWVLLWPFALVRANPVMDAGFYVEQVPGTRHVRLIFFRVFSMDTSVASYLRDERALAASWSPLPGYRANTGSGVRPVSAVQSCDCNVPLGRHVFRLLPEHRSDHEPADRYTVSGEVVAYKSFTEEPPDISRFPEDIGQDVLRLWRKRQAEEAKANIPKGTDCHEECAGDTELLPAPMPTQEAVERSEVIPTGYLMLDGRYIRPPHRLVLSGSRLEVNGALIQSWASGETAKRRLAAFEEMAALLKGSGLWVRCGRGSGAGKYGVKPAEATKLLSTIDAIVKSRAPDDAKLERLRDGSALFAFVGSCANDVLRRWDGYR